MMINIVVRISAGLMIMAAAASAQVCSVGYERAVRPIILRQLTEPTNVLFRLAEIAEIGANNGLTFGQREAYDAEVQALKVYLASLGDRTRRRLSLRANQFLSEVIDPAYLNLSEITVKGANELEAQANSRNALNALNMAISSLEVCLSGSWDRRVIVGTPNDNNCGGGYDRSDRRLVRRVAENAREALVSMAISAERAANGVYSPSSRKVLDFDLQYEKEEVDIVGESNYRGATARTKQFIRTVIDPVFLGVIDARLDGATVAESQQNARNALDALNSGILTVSQCTR